MGQIYIELLMTPFSENFQQYLTFTFTVSTKGTDGQNTKFQSTSCKFGVGYHYYC